MATSETESDPAVVSEDKFNGTATFTVRNVKDSDHAKAAARRFWRDEYGSRPSKVVADPDDHIQKGVWTVMVADHSSGSLKDSKEIDL